MMYDVHLLDNARRDLGLGFCFSVKESIFSKLSKLFHTFVVYHCH